MSYNWQRHWHNIVLGQLKCIKTNVMAIIIFVCSHSNHYACHKINQLLNIKHYQSLHKCNTFNIQWGIQTVPNANMNFYQNTLHQCIKNITMNNNDTNFSKANLLHVPQTANNKSTIIWVTKWELSLPAWISWMPGSLTWSSPPFTTNHKQEVYGVKTNTDFFITLSIKTH